MSVYLSVAIASSLDNQRSGSTRRYHDGHSTMTPKVKLSPSENKSKPDGTASSVSYCVSYYLTESHIISHYLSISHTNSQNLILSLNNSYYYLTL